MRALALWVPSFSIEISLMQSIPLSILVFQVLLDRGHVSAWTALGHLYEVHRQFGHALYCYREAAAQGRGESAMRSVCELGARPRHQLAIAS